MAGTKIEWTRNNGGALGKVWNPVRGCTRVSAGCEHCYAERMAHRFSGRGQPYEGLTSMTERGPGWTGQALFVPEMLDLPLRWKKPRRVFVDSMGDLFHKDITNEQIAAVFGVMGACPQHTFHVLTKRPERMLEWFGGVEHEYERNSLPWKTSRLYFDARCHDVKMPPEPRHGVQWPLPNVILVVSCEDQPAADERISLLIDTPAAMRGVSLEPLLGPIDLSAFLRGFRNRAPTSPGLDWVIVGSESGPGARPMNLDWVRSIRDQCNAADVPLFLKQAVIDGKLVKMPPLDGVRWDEDPFWDEEF